MSKIEKRELVFLSSRVGRGGAEKHLAQLINKLSDLNYNVTLLITRPGGNYEDSIRPDIDIIYLTSLRKSYSFSLVSSILALRSYVKDHKGVKIVAVQDGPISIALLIKALFTKNYFIVGWVQNNPQYLMQSLIGRVINSVLKANLDSISHLIALSEGVRQEYISNFDLESTRTSVVPNIAYQESSLSEESSNKPNGIKLVTCGRLESQKNYPFLFSVFKSVLISFPDTELHIIGDGKLKATLLTLAGKLGIENQITWHGFVNNPVEIMSSCDIFLLTSDYEGFGNVIVEAMSVSLPVISTDCPYGPSEIIADGENGFLVKVGDEDQYLACINRLILNKNLRIAIGKAGNQKSREYSAEIITNKFLQTYNSIKW